MQAEEIQCTLEWNQGGHFKDPTLRVAKAFAWVLNTENEKRKKWIIYEIKNILIVVKDLEKAKTFYHDLFGLDVILDQDGNVILTEGLVLQDEKDLGQFFEKRDSIGTQFF